MIKVMEAYSPSSFKLVAAAVLSCDIFFCQFANNSMLYSSESLYTQSFYLLISLVSLVLVDIAMLCYTASEDGPQFSLGQNEG